MEEMMNPAPEVMPEVEQTEQIDVEQPKEQDTEQPKEQPTEEKKPKGEKSAWYAEMRRRVQSKDREAAEATAKVGRLMEALKAAGHDGTPEEIADKLEADARGITVSELNNERQRMAEAAKNMPEYKQAEEERDRYKALYEDLLFRDHLATIKAAHPEETAENITELGETFLSLMAMKQRNGDVTEEDVLIAYEMAALEKQRKTKPVPESPGKLNSTNGGEKEFYSPAEVDRLTEAQLNNPKIIEKVMQSMTRWK